MEKITNILLQNLNLSIIITNVKNLQRNLGGKK